MSVMTIPECEKWLADCNVRLTQWGWMPVHKKLAKYIRQRTTKSFRAHKDPDGTPWPKKEVWVPKKKLRIGTKAIIGIDWRPGSSNYGKPYRRKIKTEDELLEAKRLQWWPEFLAAEHKSKFFPALYRRKGNDEARVKPATTLYEKFNEAGRRTGSGGVVHQGKFHFRFGLHGWMNKLEGLHWGDTKYRDQPIHKRPLLGLNKADVDFVMKAYADHAMKRIGKKNSD